MFHQTHAYYDDVPHLRESDISSNRSTRFTKPCNHNKYDYNAATFNDNTNT